MQKEASRNTPISSDKVQKDMESSVKSIARDK
jgi:hypothetical protein